MSRTPRWLAALALIAGLSLTAYAVTGDQPPPDAHCVEVPELGVFVCGTTTSSSTSTTSPSTTTTSQPTTTSSAPTTTSTTIGTELVIPPTQQQTIPGFKDNESFKVEIACIESAEVDCDENPSGKHAIASFDYLAHGMPYLYPEGEPGSHEHAWWVSGDREGYRCAYGFMYDQHPNPFGSLPEPRPAEFIARFTIVRPVGYGKVNDTYMEEAERYYDGSPTPYFGTDAKEIPEEDCVQAALEPDFDYENYVPHGADEIRVGLFRSDGVIADIRDFTEVDVLVPGHFEFISLEGGRAQIVFVLGATGKVSHVFYYDTFNSGRIAVEVNGQTIGE